MGSSLPLEAPSSGQNILPSLPVAQALVSGSNLHNSNNLVRTVNPGDRVNIPCSLANVGGSIQFAKDDQPIILDSGCAHCQLDISNDGQASLTINRVSRKDQGHWQCWRLDNGKVINKIPIIQLVITNSPELPILIVNDKELVGGNNLDATITVKENEIVNFKCVIKGATTPVDYVHWMLDSSQNVTQMSQLIMEYSVENNYITQSLLKLNATKSMNLKSISCLSNHQLWLTPMTVTAFLNILYEPSFTISREPGFGVPVIEGMQVILKCEIDSNPSSSPIWIKDADNKTTTNSANNNAAAATNNNQNNNNNAISSSKEASGEPIVLYTQDDGSVIFQPAQKSDSGWYRCKTENKYGNFSSFGYYLNVRPAGTTSSQQQQQQQTPVHQPQPQQPIGQQQQQQYQQSPRFSISQTQPQPQQPVRTVESIYNSNPGGKIMAPNQAAAQTRLPHSNHFTPPSNNIINNDQPSVISSPSLFASTPPALPPPLPLPMPFNPNFANAIGGQNANMAASSNLCKPNSGGRIDGFPEIDHPVSTVQAVLGRHLILPLRFCCNPGPARVFWIHRVSKHNQDSGVVSFLQCCSLIHRDMSFIYSRSIKLRFELM